MKPALRPAHCPACEHVGAIPAGAPMSARLRCTACGTIATVRQSVGERPAGFHHGPSKQGARDAAISEVLSRYPRELDSDRLDDLWVVPRAGEAGNP